MTCIHQHNYFFFSASYICKRIFKRLQLYLHQKRFVATVYISHVQCLARGPTAAHIKKNQLTNPVIKWITGDRPGLCPQ